MLNRLTVSALIKAVLLTAALIIVGGVALRAWESWDRLRMADRIVKVAEASADVFKSMANLRSDRASSIRSLNSDQTINPEVEKYLRDLRTTLMPALSKALRLLPTMDFPRQQSLRSRT